MIHLRRILAVACLLTMTPSFPAETYQLDIAPQPLAKALQQFAQQSGLQVVYYGEVAEGIDTTGVTGNLTAEQAMQQLLAGTELQFEALDRYTVAISFGKSARQGGAGRGSAGAAGGAAELRVAQNSQSTETTENQSSAQKSDSPSKEGESGKLEEIVVTAQKRKELLKDVPMSITLLRGEDLDKSTARSVTDALRDVPGVVVDPYGFGFVIRGITALGTGASPAAYYYDGMSYSRVNEGEIPDLSAYDLQQVEVLRGPQGTLYGANSQSGLVRVFSHDVTLDRWEFKGRALTSMTEDGGDNYQGDMALNVPIVEGKLAARAVASYKNLSGWINGPLGDHLNEGELQNYRLKLKAQPTEALSIGLSANLTRNHYDFPESIGRQSAQFRHHS